MTKISNNPLVKGASGKFGDTHVYRTVRGQLQMINTPSKPDKISVSQEVMSNKLKKGAGYWDYVKKHPELEKAYSKKITTDKFSAYHVALSDSMNPPTVHYIKTDAYKGAVGDAITIKATDDFKVERVHVTIEDSTKKIIEIGEATRKYHNKPQIFEYVATVANPTINGTVIKVYAVDIPGNHGVGEVVISNQ